MKITSANSRIESERYIKTIRTYPTYYEGRGIIICGGGVRLFTSAWVCINMLRKLNCTLPIEIWYLGPREVDQRMKETVAPLGVTCVDALEIRKRFPSRILNGWELKAYALLYSRFEEALLLDADNVPITNPEFLFETEAFKETGAIFWPDLLRLAPDRQIWNHCGVPYRDEPEFESGQIVVNKRIGWKALNLTMWYNEYSDFYYQYILGDKETFHMAFRKLGQRYTMIPNPVKLQAGVMYQHDFSGNILFQHRNGLKWNYYEDNPSLPGFRFHDECISFIDTLKTVWEGFVERDFSNGSDRLKDVVSAITSRAHRYVRVGYDERPITFLPNGRIDKGAATQERFWHIYEDQERVYLEIYGDKVKICSLNLDKDNVWRGRWLHFEKMPVELSVL